MFVIDSYLRNGDTEGLCGVRASGGVEASLNPELLIACLALLFNVPQLPRLSTLWAERGRVAGAT